MSGITITDTAMTSPATPHTATATGGGWTVSWLPGRTLDRNQATTAMTIADIVGTTGVPRVDDPIWMFLDGWAAELGLTAPGAVARASEPPGEREAGARQSGRPRSNAVRSPGRAPTRRSGPAPVNCLSVPHPGSCGSANTGNSSHEC